MRSAAPAPSSSTLARPRPDSATSRSMRCKMGGGENHRFALWDMYLVKDNHIRAAGGLSAAIDRIQRTRQDVPLEVEVESLAQLARGAAPGRSIASWWTIVRSTEVRRAVEEVDRWFVDHPAGSRAPAQGARRWPEVEVSGGLTLDNVRAYAETGADYLVGGRAHALGARAQPEPGDRRRWMREPSTARAFVRGCARDGSATRLFTRAEVESTNDVAWELAQRGAGRGRRAVADAQTRGRGRMSRAWHSSPGKGLALSRAAPSRLRRRDTDDHAAGGGARAPPRARRARPRRHAQMAERPAWCVVASSPASWPRAAAAPRART